METEFTPLLSLGGGAVIGIAAVMLMFGLGRVMGATGIISGIVFIENQTEAAWRIAFAIGLIAAPLVLLFATGTMPQVQIPNSPLLVAVGGIIVGFGASLGSGCTSGHGVCGLPRLSKRSFVAVGTFMATAALTVFVMRHILGA